MSGQEQASRLARSEARDNVFEHIRRVAGDFERLSDPTPQDYTGYWADRFTLLGTLIGSAIPILPCDRSRSEIQELRGEGRTLVFRPEGLTLLKLAHIYEEVALLEPITIWPAYYAIVSKSDHRYGWLDVADCTPAPNQYIRIEELKCVEEGRCRYGMTLETYIIASLERRDRTGVPYDHPSKTTSYSFLPGSRVRNLWTGTYIGGVYAGYNSDGDLLLGASSLSRAHFRGCRFEGVRRT